jgi:hypothetical protein
MGNALAAYQRATERRPLLVKSATSCVLFTAGDCLAQYIERGSGDEQLDFKRMARLAAWGAVFGVRGGLLKFGAANGHIFLRAAVLYASSNIIRCTSASAGGGTPILLGD